MSLRTDRLIGLRENMGLSKNKTAEALNIDRSRYGKYELGQREPDYETLQLIANYFGVSTDYLLGNSDEMSSSEAPRDYFREVYAANPKIAVILERLGGEMRDLSQEELEDIGRQAEFMIRYMKEKNRR